MILRRRSLSIGGSAKSYLKPDEPSDNLDGASSIDVRFLSPDEVFDSSVYPSNSDVSYANLPSPHRVGASSMVLYSNPRAMLAYADPRRVLDDFEASGSEQHLPKCLRRTNWRLVMHVFALSDRFVRL
jgi:hypothetical protein